MRSKFALFQTRELLLVVLPVLAVVFGAVWLALRFVDPAPPRTFVVSAATAGSPYYRYAERYKATFKRNGVELEVRESGGSLANLKALSDAASGVHAGFVQGGLASSKDTPGLLSVGRIAYEPLWVFYRAQQPIGRIEDIRGRRVAAGPPGSGTRKMADVLLERVGLGDMNPTLLSLGNLSAAEALERGDADVVILVSAADGPAVQRLLRADHVARIED